MEECRFRVFKNMLLKRIFVSKTKKVMGDWRKLLNEEIHYLFCSPNIIRASKLRRMRWAGCVTCMEDMRNANTILVRKPERRRQLGRPRYRWEDSIKTDLKQIQYKGVNWICLALDRIQWWIPVNKVMNFWVPWKML
jgi:hypothetical protein